MGKQNGASDSSHGGNSEQRDSLVTGQTSQGLDIHASLLRLTRLVAVIEIYNPVLILRTSEVLTEFRIVIRERAIYSGRAVVRSVIHGGLMTVCEVTLDESSWMEVQFTVESLENGYLRTEFNEFLREWERLYRVVPDFKVVMADMQSFLADLRLWLEQVELGIRSSPSQDRRQLDSGALDKLAEPVSRSIDTFIERFEEIAAKLDPEVEPVHRTYLRRQLHPLVLSAPFAYRAFHKPLGYAGDYEMVEMMMRSPNEGSTLFAKVLNVWLLGQAPALAHRNRVVCLKQKLMEEVVRVRAQGRAARVFNLGCGPAAEVRQFLSDGGLNEGVQFTLVDFNEETLRFVRHSLDDLQRNGRSVSAQLVKKSVHQILKEAGKTALRPPAERYDFVYCAGLFDYLTDQVCRRLTSILYDLLAPGGLLLATNVSDAMNATRPFRFSMEYLLDWHLLYRDAADLAALAPDGLKDSTTVFAEDTGLDVFLLVRRPKDA